MLSFLLLSFFTSNIFAQTAELQYNVESFNMSSGLHNGVTNDGGETFIAFTGVIRGSEAPWLRVYFKDANLGKNSFIILRSVWDGKEQKLDAISIEQWQYSSAYINGYEIEIELHVAAFDENIFFTINELAVGEFIDDDYFYFTICGPTDDRISSDQHATGRLLSIGCTAWIIPNGHFISAGHCISGSGANTVQFQVPPSLPNGTLQHPGPEDQYSVNVSTKVFVNGGIGNDWGTFEVFPNSVTGLLPKEAQGAFWPLVQDLGPDSIRITGYGVDTGEANQTQQTHVGPNAGSSGTTMRYVTDTRGGNSGSPVIDELTGNALGVHTHGGCTSAGGNNNGTSTFNSAFWIAVEQGAGSCPVEAASNPNPANGTTDVSINIAELTWTNGADAISNELYFGTDPGNLPLVQSGTLATSWNVTGGPLSYQTIYYWQVVEIGDTCSTNGPFWNFITEIDPSIQVLFSDNFEDGSLTNWTVTNDGGTCVWDALDISTNSYTLPASAAGLLLSADSDFCGSGTTLLSTATMNTSVDASLYQTVWVEWDNDWRTLDGADEAHLEISIDGGITWTIVVSWIGVDKRDSHENWDVTSIAALQSSVMFRFISIQPGWDWWWVVDNFTVLATDFIPVELASFAATVNDGNVVLSWSTATETNNSGFEIQRSDKNSNDWKRISFVPGFGTSTEIHSYTFTDENVVTGIYSYRLKQIDYDGTSEYSNIIEAEVFPPKVFSLEQNYPNPFNPGTKIRFSLAADSKVTLTVFDVLGQEVVNLIGGNLAAGSHEIDFNASNINSGVYFYRIDATGVDGSNFTSVKKIILTK